MADVFISYARSDRQRVARGVLNHAKIDPDLDSLRADPRFKAMIAAAEARLAGD